MKNKIKFLFDTLLNASMFIGLYFMIYGVGAHGFELFKTNHKGYYDYALTAILVFGVLFGGWRTLKNRKENN